MSFGLRSRLFTALLTVLAGGARAERAEPAAPSSCGLAVLVRDDARAPVKALELLDAESVSWTLEARGGVATGTLELVFEAPDEDGIARVGLDPSGRVRIEGRELLSGAEVVAAGPIAQDAGRARRRPQERAPWDDVPVRAGRPLVARYDVAVALDVRSGTFALDLDRITEDCILREFPTATLPHAAPRLSVDVTVLHSGDLTLAGEPSHAMVREDVEDGTRFRLEGEATAEARGVHLAWKLGAPDRTEASAWTRETGRGAREISVLVTAPTAPDEAAVRSKEVVFVLDTSGSMAMDGKLDSAREALERCIAALRPRDAFNVVAFSDQPRAMLPSPQPMADAAPARAWLSGLRPMGGTRLAPAMSLALSSTRGGDHRLVVLLSDGILGDEEDTLRLIESELGDARLLVVAVGADANREAARRIAERGRGEALVVGDARALVASVTGLLDSFASPFAWDLAFDWGPAVVTRTTPSPVPDLYAGHPLTLRATFEGEAPEVVRVTGATTAGPGTFAQEIPVDRGR